MKKLSLLLILVIFTAFSMNAQSKKTATSNSNANKIINDDPNAPVITFEKTTHNYGNVVQGGNGTCYFNFTNDGKEPLILQKPVSSCGCTVPTWPKTPILPGESDKIKVTYNTKRLGSINKTVTVKSNAKNNTVILRIKGKVVAKPPEQVPEKKPTEGTPVNK